MKYYGKDYFKMGDENVHPFLNVFKGTNPQQQWKTERMLPAPGKFWGNSWKIESRWSQDVRETKSEKTTVQNTQMRKSLLEANSRIIKVQSQ